MRIGQDRLGPTEAEIKAGEKDEEVDDEPVEKSEEASDVKGIPEFWLSAMKNQVSLAEMITDRDEAALRYVLMSVWNILTTPVSV